MSAADAALDDAPRVRLVEDPPRDALGATPEAWLATLDGLETNRAHQLVVRTTLQATRDDDVFALGDCAACPWPEAKRDGAILPPRAQVAHQQAEHLLQVPLRPARREERGEVSDPHHRTTANAGTRRGRRTAAGDGTTRASRQRRMVMTRPIIT